MKTNEPQSLENVYLATMFSGLDKPRSSKLPPVPISANSNQNTSSTHPDESRSGKKAGNQIVSFNHYEEIRKKSSSPPSRLDEKSTGLVNSSLRRAQSELTFELFEKIVKRVQSNFSNCYNLSDTNKNFQNSLGNLFGY